MCLESLPVFCDVCLAFQGGKGGGGGGDGGGGDGSINRSSGWVKERKVMISAKSLSFVSKCGYEIIYEDLPSFLGIRNYLSFHAGTRSYERKCRYDTI